MSDSLAALRTFDSSRLNTVDLDAAASSLSLPFLFRVSNWVVWIGGWGDLDWVRVALRRLCSREDRTRLNVLCGGSG